MNNALIKKLNDIKFGILLRADFKGTNLFILSENIPLQWYVTLHLSITLWGIICMHLFSFVERHFLD